MRLTILGATGRIVSLVLADALATGRVATVLSRGRAPLPAGDRVTVVTGDIADPSRWLVARRATSVRVRTA